jgi:hypothetical protein
VSETHHVHFISNLYLFIFLNPSIQKKGYRISVKFIYLELRFFYGSTSILACYLKYKFIYFGYWNMRHEIKVFGIYIE